MSQLSNFLPQHKIVLKAFKDESKAVLSLVNLLNIDTKESEEIVKKVKEGETVEIFSSHFELAELKKEQLNSEELEVTLTKK